MATEVAFACDMSAMTPQERQAHSRVIREVFGAVTNIRELSNGYAFDVPAASELLAQAGEFVSLERLCCPFFDFSLDLPRAASSFGMHVTGPAGVKSFIQAEFSNALPVSTGFPGG